MYYCEDNQYEDVESKWDWVPMDDFHQAADWFDEIIELLYGKKPFNAAKLENALEELGYLLKIQVPNKDLCIREKTHMSPLGRKLFKFATALSASYQKQISKGEIR